MAIDLDGTIRWGDGSGDFDSALRRSMSSTLLWDPPPLAPERAIKTTVGVHGARPGDVVTVSHEHAGPYMLSWSAHVSAPGTVMVVVRNSEEARVDLALGRLTVAVSRYG